MKVLTAKSGFCIGIRQAYQGMDNMAAKGEKVHALHECTTPHKNKEWDTLHRIEDRDPELLRQYPNLDKLDLPHEWEKLGLNDKVVVGFHGLEKTVKDALKGQGVEMRDLQCPFISKLNRTAESLASEGYDLIAFGKPLNHHCLYAKRLAEEQGRTCVITEDYESIKGLIAEPGRRWACVGQVTGNSVKWKALIAALNAGPVPVRIEETVCSDTFERQAEAMELSRQADVVVVVNDGGGSSGSVVEVCQKENPRTFSVGTDMPLKREWFVNASRVAVVGGILVPSWIIEKTAKEIEALVA